MIKDHLPLIHGLIDAFLFLETAGPNEVNPDSAVRCMENIASSLHALDKADQLALRSLLEKVADDSYNQSYKEFVKALPDAIGLASSGPQSC